MPMTPAQCRAARALLGLSQRELARLSGVAPRTLADFETGRRLSQRRTIGALRSALERAGAILLSPSESVPGGHGVRFRALSEVNGGRQDSEPIPEPSR